MNWFISFKKFTIMLVTIQLGSFFALQFFLVTWIWIFFLPKTLEGLFIATANLNSKTQHFNRRKLISLFTIRPSAASDQTKLSQLSFDTDYLCIAFLLFHALTHPNIDFAVDSQRQSYQRLSEDHILQVSHQAVNNQRGEGASKE